MWITGVFGVSRKGAKAQRKIKNNIKENYNIMTENEIAKIIVDAAYHVHKKLGPGLLESVYEVILAHALDEQRIEG